MRQIKLFVMVASLLLGACGGMPRTPDAISTGAVPAKLHCVQDTGSRIKPREGECLNVAGRSYSGERLRSDGALGTADAIRRLGL